MKRNNPLIYLFFLLLIVNKTTFAVKGYKNFNVAIYCTVNDVKAMSDNIDMLKKELEFLEKYIHIDKVYLETHRHHYLIEEERLEKVKKVFNEKGINTSGGITTTGKVKVANHFPVYCYTNKANKEHLKKVVQFTAKHFDEIILDDFYFTSCKCGSCINEKGERSWAEFRKNLMDNISNEIFIKPAKDINPNVNMIIKFPNWYEYYQYTGYDLENESKIFDMIYTGTEARDPVYHQQNIQPYQSYSIIRYLENVKPDKNGGGWLDPLDKRVLERYAEQIRLTLFAKAKEVTLFHYHALFNKINDEEFESFITPVAGNVFRKIDSFFNKLGKPVGIASYRPYNASGEPFLHSYLGMLGIPVELTPNYPSKSKTIILTEGAKADSNIISKMKTSLLKGKKIIITSGFFNAMQNKGISDIITVKQNGKQFLANKFTDLNFNNIYVAENDILFSQIEFATNDSWKEVAAISNGNSYPILLQSSYGKGAIILLVLPDNFNDLYQLPGETITAIKNFIADDLPVKMEAEAKVALFLYDNNTFILHSFLPHKTKVKFKIKKAQNDLLFNVLTGKEVKKKNEEYEILLKPYSYQVYKW